MAITGCLRQIKTFIKVGEQFDAPNMLLLPSAACLPGPLAPLRVHVRAQCDFFYLVTENRNTAHYFAEMISWRLGLGVKRSRQLGCWCCVLPLCSVSCAEHIPTAGAFQPASSSPFFGRRNSTTVYRLTAPSSERLAG